MVSSSSIKLYEALTFDTRFTDKLPADPDTAKRPRQVFRSCYSFVDPTPVKKPEVIAYSPEVAAQLGLSDAICRSQVFAEVFAGNRIIPGTRPYAMCYGGHQFGQWAGQLGDGRAINLGEVITPEHGHQTLQLKGAGLTPYSRTADGLAVLRSSIREFLCSEAMHHLGVPTTRALSLALTGEQVMRDMFYNGNPRWEPGAVVCRVAPSFLRFGNFEIFTSRGETDVLRQLLDYTLRHHFPELGEPGKAVYVKWFGEVCRLTAEMIVKWMGVGFVHGVMNTDNMSVLGLTIDYGPYGWLEDYDPLWTPNTTDAHGRRYCFGNQPTIAQWNLLQLANAIYPLIGETEGLEQVLTDFVGLYQQGYRQFLANKLGLADYREESDQVLMTELLNILPLEETDMTIFFRRLADIDSGEKNPGALLARIADAYYQPEALTKDYTQRMQTWLVNYGTRIAAQGIDDSERRSAMNRVNPKYVLRNYLAQQAIDAAEAGDYSGVWELLDVMRHPYDEQPQYERYARKRPDWARDKAGCSMLSCSS